MRNAGSSSRPPLSASRGIVPRSALTMQIAPGAPSTEAGERYHSSTGHNSFTRRNISSSPTSGDIETHSKNTPVQAIRVPTTTVHGFQPSTAAASFSGFQLASASGSSALSSGSSGGLKSALTRALTSEQDLAQASAEARKIASSFELPSAPGTAPRISPPSTPSFFPGTDLAPLHRAQEQHAVFKSEQVSLAYMLAVRSQQQLSAAAPFSGTAAHTHPSLSPTAGHSTAPPSPQRVHTDSPVTRGMAVATLLAEMGLDAETVAAGLLHEVLLLTPSFVSQMEEFMPKQVVALVERVVTISDISSLYRGHNHSIADEPYRRMLMAMEDVRSVLIKLADRVVAMRSATALPQHLAVQLAIETLEVFAVVANRLGVWCLKAELEDLAFAVLHPVEAAELRHELRHRQDASALEATINHIKASLQEAGVEYEDISGRPKNLYGVWLKRGGTPCTALSSMSSMDDGGGSPGGSEQGGSPTLRSLDEIYDLTALRVVVANKHDCYRALRAVQCAYKTMPDRSKDFIKGIRKPNGYQSLHETVFGEGGRPMEVQIRTHKMHYIAEYGFAAHWKYKEKLDSEDQWLDKETQYKRWLTTHKLGVYDRKIRPNGSPPTDSSLKSLGVAFLGDDSPGGEASARVDPFLRHDRFRLVTAPAAASIVSILLQTHDTIETREFSAGITAGEVGRQLGIGKGLLGFALLVNNKLPSDLYTLRPGDLVQVMLQAEAYGRSPSERRLTFAGRSSAVPGSIAGASWPGADSRGAAVAERVVAAVAASSISADVSPAQSPASQTVLAVHSQQQQQQLSPQQLWKLQQQDDLQVFGVDIVEAVKVSPFQETPPLPYKRAGVQLAAFS
ncbi:MAG: hypothetical protein WDW38_000748 [Sanguina aurantia]